MVWLCLGTKPPRSGLWLGKDIVFVQNTCFGGVRLTNVDMT